MKDGLQNPRNNTRFCKVSTSCHAKKGLTVAIQKTAVSKKKLKFDYFNQKFS